MEQRPHPNHVKAWVLLTVVPLAMAAMPFGLGLYLHDPLGDDGLLFNLAALTFMLLLAIAMLVLGLGFHFSQCPGCKSWIRRYRAAGGDDGQVRFVCRKCNVIYDTGVKESRD